MITDEELRLARRPGGLLALTAVRYPQVVKIHHTPLRAFDADGRDVPEATVYLRQIEGAALQRLLPRGSA